MALANVTHRFDGGFSWARSSSGLLECRSHALRDADGGVWLVDPFDGTGLDEELEALGGDVVGVIVLLDRHIRDSVALARRYGARLLAPPGRWRRGHPRPQDAEALRAEGIDACPFTFTPIIQREGQWLEWSLWWPERAVLVVPEAVGTPDYYRSRAREPLAVHPVLRVAGPPHGLVAPGTEPQLLLVGHGDAVEADVAGTIELAIGEARRELPSFLLAAPRHAVRFVRAAVGVGRASC
ncbi:MAG: hypothetical protein JWM98_1362 [Thermoleophilia bacterium]|nr:hypothetical protein [Thermoleophilia bacterium]